MWDLLGINIPNIDTPLLLQTKRVNSPTNHLFAEFAFICGDRLSNNDRLN